MQPCDEAKKGTRKISHIVDALPNSAEEEDVPNGACPRTQREEKIHVSELPEYKTTIEKARRENWQRFVTIEGNRDPWGAIYKFCGRKVTSEAVVATKDWQANDKERPMWEICVYALLDSLVPDDTQDITAQKMERRAAGDLPTTSDVPPFDKEEVRRVVGSMRNSKAPSPDRIEVEVLKASYKVIHKELRDIFNACLRYGSFPGIWKQGSIRALLKDANRDASDLASYRPICLLSVMGKCLKKLLAERLRLVFMDNRYAAANQFGFPKGRSATDAILVMREMVVGSMDIYSRHSIRYQRSVRPCMLAEYTAPSAREEMSKESVPSRCRLSARTNGKHEVVSKNATKECLQGSIPEYLMISSPLNGEVCERSHTRMIS